MKENVQNFCSEMNVVVSAAMYCRTFFQNKQSLAHFLIVSASFPDGVKVCHCLDSMVFFSSVFLLVLVGKQEFVHKVETVGSVILLNSEIFNFCHVTYFMCKFITVTSSMQHVDSLTL
jgi:hypothetical protein